MSARPALSRVFGCSQVISDIHKVCPYGKPRIANSAEQRAKNSYSDARRRRLLQLPPTLSFIIYQLSISEAPWFCQDFSTFFTSTKKFDRKLKGEICQFSTFNLANLSPQIAVKPQPILKRLIINTLQNGSNFCRFVKFFYQFPPMPLSTFQVHGAGPYSTFSMLTPSKSRISSSRRAMYLSRLTRRSI